MEYEANSLTGCYSGGEDGKGADCKRRIPKTSRELGSIIGINSNRFEEEQEMYHGISYTNLSGSTKRLTLS